MLKHLQQMSSGEIGAVLGRNQLKRLDRNNEKRRHNFKIFLDHLDPEKYRTDFLLEGSCNYAFNGLSQKLLDGLKDKQVPLIEDVCESHGATFKNKKLGSFGLMSNFSFYFAHHMSTIEGGMVCTDDVGFPVFFSLKILFDEAALVTGASGGIGGAIALVASWVEALLKTL